MYRKKNQIIELIICAIDAVIVVISLTLSGYFRYGSIQQWSRVEDVRLVCTAVFLIHVTLFYSMKMTESFFRRGRYKELLLCIRYNVMMVICIAFLGFVIKNELLMSRLMMGYFFSISTILLWFTHILLRNRKRFLGTSGVKRKNLLIVTTSGLAESILENFLKSKEVMWSISGVILLDREQPKTILNGITFMGFNENYYEFSKINVVDEVFIQVDSIQKNEMFLHDMILGFENMGLVVNLNLDLFNLGFSGEKRVCSMEGYNVIAFSSRLLDYRMVLVKRAMDIVGAFIGLFITLIVGIVLTPFLLLESPGPLIFKQKRVGQNGRVFEFYKFRSMYVDAEERKGELMEKNEMKGAMFKIENDPRVTRVGRFIRRTSIDELPQFLNVLKGDMSLVGTRPPTVDEFQSYKSYQRRRMSFRPGITGLWQVSGRSDIKDFDDVVKLDLEYIDNWSVALDIKIICKTIFVVFKGTGAK